MLQLGLIEGAWLRLGAATAEISVLPEVGPLLALQLCGCSADRSVCLTHESRMRQLEQSVNTLH